jgi:hypothetical protein
VLRNVLHELLLLQVFRQLIKQLFVETHILKVALRQAVHPEDLSIPLWHWGNLRLADDLLNEGDRDG